MCNTYTDQNGELYSKIWLSSDAIELTQTELLQIVYHEIIHVIKDQAKDADEMLRLKNENLILTDFKI